MIGLIIHERRDETLSDGKLWMKYELLATSGTEFVRYEDHPVAVAVRALVSEIRLRLVSEFGDAMLDGSIPRVDGYVGQPNHKERAGIGFWVPASWSASKFTGNPVALAAVRRIATEAREDHQDRLSFIESLETPSGVPE